MAPGLTVIVAEGRLKQAEKKFKNKVQDSGMLFELREREYYEKPTTVRKRKAARAKKRLARRLEDEGMPKKLF